MPAQPGHARWCKGRENRGKSECEPERVTGKTGAGDGLGEAQPRPLPVTLSGEHRRLGRNRTSPASLPGGAQRPHWSD